MAETGKVENESRKPKTSQNKYKNKKICLGAIDIARFLVKKKVGIPYNINNPI